MAATHLAAHKKRATRRRAALAFLDESGFSERPSVRRTWAPRAQTPVLRLPFNWKRLSAIGALATTPAGRRTRLFLSLRKGNVDSAAVMEFLRNLHRHIRGKVLLLWDRLPAHRSRLTHEFIQSQRRWLRTEFLPAYAPELNPTEHVWAYLTATDLANYCPDNLDDLAGQVRRGTARLRQKHDHGQAFLRKSGLFR
jgi:transposase